MKLSVPYIDCLRLFNSEHLLTVLSQHREIIRHLFFGHVHRAVSGVWQDFPFSCVKGLNHQVALDMRGGQNPPYTHASPAYAVILLEGGDVVVHHREFTSEKIAADLCETPPPHAVKCA